MAKVRLLEKTVAERIAAGEVVERPASIVKELVENSLDAGATRITVELKAGGIKSLRVTDNGCGMSADDLALAVRRFATSKISTWDDMATLSTLGFRGEALPSIAAVSRLSIKSCLPGEDSGSELYVEGAGVPLIKPCACPPGTRIEVNDLFYNTPARLKFLRSPVAEATNIIDLLGRMAVACPHVHFRLLSNDKEVFSFPVGMNMAQRLAKLWKIPDDTLIPIGREVGDMAVDGFIALPCFTRNNRNNQLILLNGRIIKSSNLSQALIEGYTPLLPRGRFPVAVLRLFLPTDCFDVNAHPNKLEVRFVDTRPIFSLIYGAVAQALEEYQADTVHDNHLEYSREESARNFNQSELINNYCAQGEKTAIDNLPASKPIGAVDTARTRRANGEERDFGLLGIINRVDAVNANQLAFSASEKALAREGCSSKKLAKEDSNLENTLAVKSPQNVARALAGYKLLSEQPATDGKPSGLAPTADGVSTLSSSGFNGADTLSCTDASGKLLKPPSISGAETMGFAVISQAPVAEKAEAPVDPALAATIYEPASTAEKAETPVDPALAATIHEPASIAEKAETPVDPALAATIYEPAPVAEKAETPVDPDLAATIYEPASTAEKEEEQDESSSTPAPETEAHQAALFNVEEDVPAPRSSRFQLFGQVHNTFIVGLVDGELWVIDQHTAHERLNYERLGHLSPLENRSQALLVPLVLEFSPIASEYLSSASEELAEFGFEVEPFGTNTFQLRAVPSGLSERRITAVFHSLIEELVSGSVSIKHSVRETMREKLRAMTSCKAAVKAGDPMSREDMQKLIEDMLEVEHSRYCPHGRPTRIKLDQRTLERLFHR